jgi:GNAT superfamily N-acetyltransferase
VPNLRPAGSTAATGYTTPTGYIVSDDRSRVDRDAVHRFLHDDSYWAQGRPRDVTDRAIDNSLVFGAYTEAGEQAGFARVVTDHATHAWLCDVFVLPEHQGRGLARALVAAALDHPSLGGIRRVLLATLDAHGVYQPLGFTPIAHPDQWMERPGTPRG